MFGQACESKMPSRCVVFGCSNTGDPKNGVILHKIPYDGDSGPEEIKWRKRWVDFVKRKHAKWEPSSTSCICSKHFEPDAFVRKVNLPGQETTYIPWLKKDEVGVSPFPTLSTANEGDEDTTSKRTARVLIRKVRHYWKTFAYLIRYNKSYNISIDYRKNPFYRLRKKNMQQPQTSNKHLRHLHQLSWEKQMFLWRKLCIMAALQQEALFR